MAIWTTEDFKNCPHIDYISVQNLEFLALIVSEKRYLDMIAIRTDGRTGLIDFSRQTDQDYTFFQVCQMSPLTCYIQST